MSKKRPAKTSEAVELVPQEHGGALQVGNPGNKGGTGRPPSAIRERLRGSFEERIAILEQIIDDPTTSASDRIRAVDLMAKYGLGTTQEVSGPDGEAVPVSITVTRRFVGADDDDA